MLRRLLIIFLLINFQLYNVKSEKAFYTEATFFTQQDKDYFLHTVERGQTVYSISKMYNISLDTIYKLNPESESGILAGSKLKIPQESGSYFYHTIQSKETLYSVSRMYQMKGEDILDANPGLSIETFTIGRVIRIPTNRVTTPMEGTNEDCNRKITNNLLNSSDKVKSDIKSIKTALLMPFGLKEEITLQNAAGNRMVEYYEGFLLALKDLKKKGISVDLQVYDIGSGVDLLSTILKKPSMQDVNLIIGGLSEKQIKLIAAFSDEKAVPYVIPFTSKTDEPLNYYTVYQISTPQSYLYSKTSAAFCNKYKDANIIFYISDFSKNKMDFIGIVQKDLTMKKIPYKVINGDNLSLEIQNALSSTNNNVFVPSDDTAETLSNLITSLKSVLETTPQTTTVSLFGYPAWQIYTAKYSADFFHLNVAFYSIFYANPTSSKVKSFHNNYIQWYSKEMINTFPKYGILGYDTGMFFIQLLDKYGTSYDVNVNKLNYSNVQTDFYFEKVNNWGGFINTNIYLVEFSPDLTITSNRFK
jgi:LysM repeat protein